MDRKYRILLAKPGLDGHDRGIKVIAAALRDAGFEVIYTGLRQTPEQIAGAAVQEDVDAVGLSILSGAHMTLFPMVLKNMKELGVSNILLFGGGIIAESEVEELKEIGVGELFTPGATTRDIIDYLNSTLPGLKKDEKII
ncbi:MAG: cobalamin B12-binding domain-containing protein [candidate division Zixibacteria bacterium]